MKISLFESVTDSAPTTIECTWDELASGFSEHERRDTKDGPLWSPAAYAEDGSRRNADVLELSCLSLDLDDVTDEQVGAMVERLEGLGVSWLCYSSYSHVEGSGVSRLRAVVELSRPVAPSEWAGFWLRAVAHVCAPADPSCKDMARFYYTPAAPEDAPVVFQCFTGAPLDVDAVLALPAPKGAKERAKKPQKDEKKGAFDGLNDAKTTRKASVGGRNVRLTKIAGRLRSAGASEEALLVELRIANARECDPPLDDVEVENIARSIARYEPRSYYEQTHIGNAERVVDRFGELFRWVHSWQKWIVWDERRWSGAGANEAMATFVKEIARRDLFAEAANEPDDKRRAALTSWARASAGASSIRGVLEVLRSESGMRIDHTALDRDPHLLNTRSGTVDLRTGELRPFDPNDLITHVAGVDYDLEALCPSWDKFIDEITCGDAALGHYLRLCAGYAATGEVREQALFFLYGLGSNGKSTFVDLLCEALGEYAMVGAPNLLLAKKGDAHPTEQAALCGARFVSCPEVEDGKRWAESTVKQLTGGDKVTARRMHENFWDFYPTHKFFVSGNHRPVVTESVEGIWRRMRLVPFNASFLGREDKHLVDRLKAELPGILAWIVRGAVEWYAKGLKTPESVQEATNAYRADEDDIGRFFEDRCVIGPGVVGQVPRNELYQAYLMWCSVQGEGRFALSARRFCSKVRERGASETIRAVGGDRVRVWDGIELRTKAGRLRAV